MGVAVLVIDMQQSFLNGIDDDMVNVLIDNQIKVLRFCAEHDIPVAVLEFQGEGLTLNVLQWEINRVSRYRVFIKLQDDGFSNPELTSCFVGWSVDALILMGVNAGACVRETAIGALNNGFAIATSSQLISSYDRNLHIEWFKKKGGYSDNWKKLFESK